MRDKDEELRNVQYAMRDKDERITQLKNLIKPMADKLYMFRSTSFWPNARHENVSPTWHARHELNLDLTIYPVLVFEQFKIGLRRRQNL